MFPMNWFLLSLTTIFLMHLKNSKMHTMESKENRNLNKTIMKKWQW